MWLATWSSTKKVRGVSVAFEAHVFERGRVVVERDPPQAGLLHARSHPVVEEEGVDGEEEGALVREPLDPLEEDLALRPVQLAGLLLEQIVDVGVTADGVGSPRHEVVLDTGGRVAVATRATEEQVLQLLVLP